MTTDGKWKGKEFRRKLSGCKTSREILTIKGFIRKLWGKRSFSTLSGR
jgi:hypothetical protein